MEKYHMPGCHKVKSHDECRKIVHRLCSSYISSIVKYGAEQDRVGRSGVELLQNGWGLTTK